MPTKKNILITGANGNLGAVVVDHFLAAGYAVLAIVSAGKGSSLKQKGASVFECDLTDEAATAETAASIIALHGNIDAALLLAGGFAAGDIDQTDGGTLRRMYALNFETAWFTVQPLFRQMKMQSGGGRIVLIGSRPSLQPADGKHAVAYSLSKSLLFRLAEILNSEGAAKNVVTSVVVPGTIDTPANRTSMPQADTTKWVAPEEIAALLADIAENKSLRDPIYKIFGEG